MSVYAHGNTAIRYRIKYLFAMVFAPEMWTSEGTATFPPFLFSGSLDRSEVVAGVRSSEETCWGVR